MALTELNRTHTGPNAPVEQTRTADDRLEDRDDSLPINTSTSTEESAMPQLVEPTTPDAQREIIRQSLDEIATEVGTALRDAHFDFPVFLTVPNSGELTCNDGKSSRSVRRRLVTCFSHRLSHHRATTGRRSTVRTGITLRGGECNDRCRRGYGRHRERGMTVSRRPLAYLRRSRSSQTCRPVHLIVGHSDDIIPTEFMQALTVAPVRQLASAVPMPHRRRTRHPASIG